MRKFCLILFLNLPLFIYAQTNQTPGGRKTVIFQPVLWNVLDHGNFCVTTSDNQDYDKEEYNEVHEPSPSPVNCKLSDFLTEMDSTDIGIVRIETHSSPNGFDIEVYENSTAGQDARDLAYNNYLSDPNINASDIGWSNASYGFTIFITPTGISHFCSNLGESIVYINGCYSASFNTSWNSVTAIGYNDTISGYAGEDIFFQRMDGSLDNGESRSISDAKSGIPNLIVDGNEDVVLSPIVIDHQPENYGLIEEGYSGFIEFDCSMDQSISADEVITSSTRYCELNNVNWINNHRIEFQIVNITESLLVELTVHSDKSLSLHNSSQLDGNTNPIDTNGIGPNRDDYIFYASTGTHIPSGYVSGIWLFEDSPFFIDGEITISTGNTLIIEPGVEIIFSGHYKFEIYGKLLAEGSEDANINFTAQNQTTGWNGFHFVDQNTNGQDSSKVVYCKLQYGRATDAYPDNNGGVIYLDNSDILIDNCIISDNSANGGGGGLFIYNSSSPTIKRTIIRDNTSNSAGGGIHIRDYCTPYLENVCIYNNVAESEDYGRGGGIYSDNWCFPILTNVTISRNTANYDSSYPGGALFSWNNSSPSLLNCVLWDDIPQEIGEGYDRSVTVTYSDVEGGTPGVGNINADPLFADPANGDFQITWANYPLDDATKSPCIDTGSPLTPLDPDDTISDMGAFYFHQFETGPSTPEDVGVIIDADSVYITWSATRNRNTYKVYSSDDPYSGFTEDLTGTYSETSWSAPFPIADDKKFYYVTSSDEREQAQIENPEKNKRILK